MLTYIIKRVLLLIPLIILISIVVFVIINLPPGDFLTSYINNLRTQGLHVTEEMIRAYEVRYGLGYPVHVQYMRWFSAILQGDLGYSFVWNRSVNALVADRLGNTIFLAVSSIVLIWIVSFPLGFYSATKPYTIPDYTFTSISFFGMSVPEFLLAIVLMWMTFRFSGNMIIGMYAAQFTGQPMSWDKLVSMAQHMWLPYLVIIITGTAWSFKTFRANLMDELNMPYVKAARARGVPPTKLLVKYPVRIALIPFISTLGWLLPWQISGQTLLAIVMDLPTLAPLLLGALRTQDMFLAGSILFIICIMTVIGTLVSDILLALLDPRVRSSL